MSDLKVGNFYVFDDEEGFLTVKAVLREQKIQLAVSTGKFYLADWKDHTPATRNEVLAWHEKRIEHLRETAEIFKIKYELAHNELEEAEADLYDFENLQSLSKQELKNERLQTESVLCFYGTFKRQ